MEDYLINLATFGWRNRSQDPNALKKYCIAWRTDMEGVINTNGLSPIELEKKIEKNIKKTFFTSEQPIQKTKRK